MLQLSTKPLSTHLLASILIAISSRIALFFGSMVAPIPNESGLPISPLTSNTALDLVFYQWAQNMYFGEPYAVIEHFERFFKGNGSGSFFLPGPLYPSLLQLFGYAQGSTLLLSVVFLLVSAGLVAAWLWWLSRQGVGPVWLYLFALLPTPFWFMLNVSTDLLFAAIVGAFWLLWFDGQRQSARRMASVALVVVIAGLLRPNAMSLLLFLCVDVLIWQVALQDQRQARRRGLAFVALIGVITICFAVFYMPYFHWVLNHSGGAGYFGQLPTEYLQGLWPNLPVALNLGLSWLSLIAAKLLYLTGLRPSFGDTAALLVILRLLPGLIMLPGLLWLLLRADWRVRLFTVIFLAPIIMGISQDRYVLPIQPVLFFYGIKAWRDFALLFAKVRFRSAQVRGGIASPRLARDGSIFDERLWETALQRLFFT